MNSTDMNLTSLIEKVTNDLKKDNISLESIEKDTREILDLTIISQLIDRDNIFFAHILVNMVRNIDFKLRAPASVYIRNTQPNIDFNPILLFNMNGGEPVTPELIMALMIHEIYHIMHNHIERAKDWEYKANHRTLNIGMDVAINQFIPLFKDDDISMNIGTLAEMLDMDRSDIEPRREYEYYVDLILNSDEYQEAMERRKELMDKLNELLDELNEAMSNDNDEGENPDGGSDSDENNDETSDSDDSDTNGENDKESTDGEGKGKRPASDIMNDIADVLDELGIPIDHSDWDETTDHDANNMDSIIKRIVNDAASKSRGNIPGDVQEIIDKINTPPVIKWQDELSKMVGSIPVPFKKTMLRRSRRQYDRADIRGRISDRELDMVVAIDTSGSMDRTQLEFAFNEIFHIIKGRKYRLTIIECDTEVGKVYQAYDEKDIQYEVSGRGGTSFTPVFEYIKDERMDPDLVVYFTDGFGEGEIPLKYISRSTKYMFVLTDRVEDLSLGSPNYAIVKELRYAEGMDR